MTKYVLHTIVTLCVLCCRPSFADTSRSRLKGQVFEAEEWSLPAEGWVKDEHPADKWCLWTQEQDVEKKRSGGQSLRSPFIKADRTTPEEGAPPLHTRITGLSNGLYRVWMNNPARIIALSFDGRTWMPYRAQGELDLGMHRVKDGSFDLWVDDRYAFAEKPGSCYYDYLRFEPCTPPEIRNLTSFNLPDGKTQLSWITDTPAYGCKVYYGTGDKLDSYIESATDGLRNHAAILPDLPAGREFAAEIRIGHHGEEITRSGRISFTAGVRPAPGPTKTMKVPLRIAEPAATGRKAWPVTSGIPFAQGVLASDRDVLLQSASGKNIPAQFETLVRWPDGSVRWLLADFLTDTSKSMPAEYTLITERDASSGTATSNLIKESPDGYLLDPGPINITIERNTFALPGRVVLPGKEIITLPGGTAELKFADNRLYRAGKPERITVETNGPQRGTIRVEGHYVDKQDKPGMTYRMRITVYRGREDIRLQWTIGNDMTKQMFAELNSASLKLSLQSPGEVSASLTAGDDTVVSSGKPLKVWQNYDNHVFTIREGIAKEGEKESGFTRVRTDEVVIDAMIRDFWQSYPKGIEVNENEIRLDLLPALPPIQYSRPEDRTDNRLISLFYCYRDGRYLFKRGMESSCDIMLSYSREPQEPGAEKAEHWQNPLMAAAPPEQYCSSGAFWWVTPQESGEFPRYAKAFEKSFRELEEGRQKRHEYGWMNYGDWFGERSWNWGNSEYDLQYVCAEHFARTGDLAVFWRGDQMARHNTSVDVVHYPWQSPMRELVYAHSVGHVGGFFERDDSRIKNKTYSMAGFIDGARDGSGGHTFQGGNFLYGFLTGDRRYLEVAEKVCWNQAEQYTRNWDFRIERACGWSLYNAMSAYESTLNPYYLNAATIYLEKVYELQDPETGGWRMPQGPPECECPDAPHIGGKAFATGVLLHGMMMVDRVEPSQELRKSLVRGVDWLLDHSWNEHKKGFRYKTGCPKYADHGWYTTLVTDGIAYAYELTGNQRYRDFLLRTLPEPISKTTGSGRGCGKNFTSNFRNLPHTLYFLKKWNVTSLEEQPE